MLFLLLEKKRPAWAGVSLILLAAKPHLVYLFWLTFLWWSVEQKRWKTLAACLGTVVVAAVVADLFRARKMR